VDGDQDCEPRYANADWEDDEEEAMLQAIGEPGYEHTECEGGGPGRHAVQLCLDRGVAITLQDAGGEVGIAVRWNNETEVHEAADKNLRIPEDATYIGYLDWAFGGRLALVGLKAPCYECSLLFGEPLNLFREAREQEEEED